MGDVYKKLLLNTLIQTLYQHVSTGEDKTAA